MATDKRLIIGISGASGVIYGVRLLETLRGSGVETHLVMTKSAEMTLAYETKLKVADVHRLADAVHPIADVGASISSGWGSRFSGGRHFTTLAMKTLRRSRPMEPMSSSRNLPEAPTKGRPCWSS